MVKGGPAHSQDEAGRPRRVHSPGCQAPFVQIFTFDKGQRTGFATFVGKDTGKRAKIPIAPFMGVYGVAPLRKGMYRTVPPNVNGGMGGNTPSSRPATGTWRPRRERGTGSASP